LTRKKAKIPLRAYYEFIVDTKLTLKTLNRNSENRRASWRFPNEDETIFNLDWYEVSGGMTYARHDFD